MQIDCYGFEATSQFFKRMKLEAYLIKNLSGTIYACFSDNPSGPIHRIDKAEDGSLRMMWAFGKWEEAEILDYIPINETMELKEMEPVVIPPPGGGAGAGLPSLLRYPIAEKTVVDGTVQLADRTVNVVKLDSSDAVRVIFPSKAEGCARDFILRIEVSVSTVPEIAFVGAEGESVKVEDDGLSDLGAKYGANIYAVTETAPSRLFVIRKSAYLVGEAS